MNQERIDTYKALEAAHEAFEKYLQKIGNDPSYWSIRFTVWILSQEGFQPLDKIELDTRGSGDGKYHDDK